MKKTTVPIPFPGSHLGQTDARAPHNTVRSSQAVHKQHQKPIDALSSATHPVVTVPGQDLFAVQSELNNLVPAMFGGI
jgi:hypothetical protein